MGNKKPPSPIKAFVGRRAVRADAKGYASHARAEANAKASMDAVLKQFQMFVDHTDSQAEEVLKWALWPAFNLSQILVPKDTWKLWESGYLEGRRFRGKAVAEIGYGAGGNPVYAAMVHERPDLKHEAPTQYKYLEAAIAEHADQIKADIIAGFQKSAGMSKKGPSGEKERVRVKAPSRPMKPRVRVKATGRKT